jgi:hypothetical protein
VAKDHDLNISLQPIAGRGQTEDGTDHEIEEREQHPRILGSRRPGGESGFRYLSGPVFAGHFLPEEAPEETARNLLGFLDA